MSSPVSWRIDPRDIALELCREMLAPPHPALLSSAALLAVAPVPGKDPAEWRYVAPGTWVAWLYAAGAGCCAEEMTAGQLRAILAERDASA